MSSDRAPHGQARPSAGASIGRAGPSVGAPVEWVGPLVGQWGGWGRRWVSGLSGEAPVGG
jgi:hypothetical protein